MFISKTQDSTTQHLTYQKLDTLLCLRGFCAFYVVVFHARYSWVGAQQYLVVHPYKSFNLLAYSILTIHFIASAGHAMVIFFFVLSGFFIRYAQLKKHRSPIAFYINRIIRIYPPYIASIILAICVIWIIGNYFPEAMRIVHNQPLTTGIANAWLTLHHIQLTDIILALTFKPLAKGYIGYNPVYWSLLPEGLFYLFVPFAFWRIRIYYIFSVICYLVGVFFPHIIFSLPAIISYWMTYNIFFAVGVMLYDCIVHYPRWLQWFQRVSGLILAIICGLLFLAIIGLTPKQQERFAELITTVLAIASISALLADKVNTKIFFIRACHNIRAWSYSLYLYHFPLLLLCYAILVHLTRTYAFYKPYYLLAVIIATGVSYSLYTITERASVRYFRGK